MELFNGGAAGVALRLFRSALALMDPDAEDRCEALLEIGEAERRIPGSDHRSTFLAAAALARARGDVERLARAAKGISRGFVILGPEPDAERLELLAEAAEQLAAVDRYGRLHAQILGALAGELRLAGEEDRSREVVRDAVEVARRTGEVDVIVHALATRWDVELHPSTGVLRGQIAEELAGALDDPAADPQVLARVAWAGFGVALELDDHDAAVASLGALEAAASLSSDPEILWRAEVVRATWAMRQGDHEDALALLDRAAATGAELGLVEVIATHAAQSVLVCAAAGRHEELAERLPDLVTLLPAGRAAAALRDATSGRLAAAERAVEGLLGPDGLVLPRDATWPFGVAVLARTAPILGHRPLARAVAAALADVDVVRLAHPTYDAGPVALARGLVAPLLTEP
jgi:tetratricopeptide (TPR) repeat protein